MEMATFAAGCFWGVEETFRRLPGVQSTQVGYTSGSLPDPDYRSVCTGTTGHAEAVEIKYDPELISYEQLMDVFFENHDPTTLNRQGPDIGTQYRSGIYYHNPAQKRAAEVAREKLQASGRYRRPIVTEIVPATFFYPAEDYHQQYLAKRGLPGCHL